MFGGGSSTVLEHVDRDVPCRREKKRLCVGEPPVLARPQQPDVRFLPDTIVIRKRRKRFSRWARSAGSFGFTSSANHFASPPSWPGIAGQEGSAEPGNWVCSVGGIGRSGVRRPRDGGDESFEPWMRAVERNSGKRRAVNFFVQTTN
jgi:hypothetical protein